jgi:di/tricarboxylate transporter
VRLKGGDAVLLALPRERADAVRADPAFVLATEIETEDYRTERMPVALALLGAVVLAAAVGLVPIVVSALVGTVALVLTGCLTTDEAYQAVNWKVIFLLAGVLPLKTAMQTSGAADLLAAGLLGALGDLGPRAVLSGFFFAAMTLTNVVSNQATAALLAPITFQAADALDVSVRPFLVAVTFAASLSFMTPVGYQTNTMIYGPGQYRFTDFLKVGTPLNLLLWAMGTLLIPVFWPF